jgi:hypothetical protein
MPLLQADALSANFLRDPAGGGQPQFKNNFVLSFPYDNRTGLGELTFALKSLAIPPEASEVHAIKIFNEFVKYAGTPTNWEDMTVNYRDYVGIDILNELYKWRRTVYNPITGNVGYMAHYKRSGWIYSFPPSNLHSLDLSLTEAMNLNTTKRWKVIGGFIKSLKPGDYDMESTGEQVEIAVTFAIDKMLWTPIDGDSLA